MFFSTSPITEYYTYIQYLYKIDIHSNTLEMDVKKYIQYHSIFEDDILHG